MAMRIIATSSVHPCERECISKEWDGDPIRDDAEEHPRIPLWELGGRTVRVERVDFEQEVHIFLDPQDMETLYEDFGWDLESKVRAREVNKCFPAQRVAA